MKLKKIVIENYKQFDKAEILIDNNLTIIAGANNTGKTSLVTLINNISSSERSVYKRSDVPAHNIRAWAEKIYSFFKDFFYSGKKSSELEDQLIEKLFPNNDAQDRASWFLMKTTSVNFQIDYDIAKDDIKLFVDYIMDLDEQQHSFYFQYLYEFNRKLFLQNMMEEYEKLQQRFETLSDMEQEHKNNCDVKERYIKEMLADIYLNSIKPACYFCDSTYQNRCEMNDASDFKKLLNFKFLKASRPLDDIDEDHSRFLSKQMIKLAQLDSEWNALIGKLPDEMLSQIQNTNIEDKVKQTSFNSLKSTIEILEKTNGGHSGELGLSMNVTENDVSDLLQHITSTSYNVDGCYLGESSQGLGYSNLIYMHLQLKEFENDIDPLKLNEFFLEEPESHMHPQMQQVFIKYLIKHYKENDLQGIITSHSNEMVRVAGISRLRVIRKKGPFTSNLVDLSLLMEKLKENKNCDDDILINFYDWFFEIGYSDVIFADKAVLYEGDTERLMIRKLLTLPKYEKLSQQYISFIQVGGAYAYNYKKLLEEIGLKSVIFTDIDYDKGKINIAEIKNSLTTNTTLKKFYSDTCLDTDTTKVSVNDLYKWKTEKKNIIDNQLFIVFQTEEDQYTRTLEEAILCKIFGITVETKKKKSEWETFKKDTKLKFSVPMNKKEETDSEFSVRDILKSTSNGKTDFMYSLILKGKLSEGEPHYIEEGLKWLMD